MRIKTVSLLSFFVCLPALADVRLPIVNIGSASVSARNAFGQLSQYGSFKAPDSSELYGDEPVSKEVIADNSVKFEPLSEKLPVVASNELLIPNKPSGDLWANNDNAKAGIKMDIPVSSAFNTLSEDYELPEENLDSQIVQVRKNKSEIDNQIAKLVELQKRADESAKEKPTTISSYDLKNADSFVRSDVIDIKSPASKKELILDKDDSEQVAINRVVVPMKSDVIVRSVKPVLKNTNKFKSDSDLAKLSPQALKMAFQKTYLSENKHLSTYQIDDRFDIASDVSNSAEGFTAQRDLSESGGVRTLEVKIAFHSDDSALSRDNYNLLTEYAGIVVSNPKRAIQVSIPQEVTLSLDGRKLTARRLAIVEQVLRDSGISDNRIMPVLSQRSGNDFVLRVISSDQYQTLSQQKKDMFGDSINKKTYKSLSW